MGREPGAQIRPQDVALSIFNNAIKYVTQSVARTDSEVIKLLAIDYSLNQIVRIKEALYFCAVTDSYIPHEGIAFYEEVRIIISNF